MSKDYMILEVLNEVIFNTPMMYLGILCAIILGLLIGSFLNVVALRYNTGKSLNGRSACFSCGKQLSWYELIPVFSWLAQRGRCRSCHSRVSSYYFFGELLTGIIFGSIAARGLFTSSVDMLSQSYLIATGFLFLVFSILIVIFLYDIRHKIIPDRLSVMFALLSFVSLFFFDMSSLGFLYSGFHIPSLVNFLAGIIIPLPFVVLWLISKGRWIGLGDPKLMVGMGWLLGMAFGVSAVFVSFWIGTLFAISIMIVNGLFKKTLLRTGKKSIMKEELPFAPFLIVGTLVTVIFHLNLFFF